MAVDLKPQHTTTPRCACMGDGTKICIIWHIHMLQYHMNILLKGIFCTPPLDLWRPLKLAQSGLTFFGFIECFMTTFLHTHSWLSWVDEDDWCGWGWFEIKARKHYIHHKDYIKITPEAPGVRPRDWILNCTIIGTADSGNVQVRQAPVARGSGTYNQVLNFGSPQTQGEWRLQPGLKFGSPQTQGVQIFWT